MIVLDTHVLVWWLAESRKLSKIARSAIGRSLRKRAIAISSISIFEVATLVRRERLQLAIGIDRWLTAVQSLPELSIEPVSAQIAFDAGSFGPNFPGDPADRLIVATARALDAQLISADDQLRRAGLIETIW